MTPYYCKKKDDGYYVIDSLGNTPDKGPYCELKYARAEQKRLNRIHMNRYYPGDITVHDRYIEHGGLLYPKGTCTQKNGSGGKYYWHKKMSWLWIEGFMWRYTSKTYRDGVLHKECSQLVTGSDLSDHGLRIK